jgi:integrating conjugative element protein (TIGR03765 family)
MVKHIIGIVLCTVSLSSLADSGGLDLDSIWESKERLTVTHDSGKAVAIGEYYTPNIQQSKEKRSSLLKEEAVKALRKHLIPDQDIIAAIQKGHFPVKPDVIKLSRTAVTEMRDIPQIQENMFVIGNDEFSLEWAVKNKSELLKFKAIGLLTKVKSRKELMDIYELLKPLRLMPISADFVSDNFDVWVYPALITQKGIFR